METSTLELPRPSAPTAVPPAFDWDKLRAELAARKLAPVAAAPVSVRVKLELDLAEASTLYLKLKGISSRAAQEDPPVGQAGSPRSDPTRLLQMLESALRKLRPTSKRVRHNPAALALEIAPYEAAYLHRIVQNDKRDELRRSRIETRLFSSLDALLDDAESPESEGGRALLPGLSEPSDPEARLRLSGLKRAIAELPQELRRLLPVLEQADGNVSEVARLLGQPQRKTARQVARLRKQLE